MIGAMARPTASSLTPTGVRTASSSKDDPQAAAGDVIDAIDPSTLAGILIFCSSHYDLDQVARAINRRCEGIPVVGCTSSGEITSAGLSEGSITAIGFPASEFALHPMRFEDLDHFDGVVAQHQVRRLIADATTASAELGPTISRAALFLVDGLSHREEMLAATLQEALGEIPLIGGSSGDGMAFKQTFIFHEGQFRRDAALVAVLSSRRPMTVFRVQHYAPGDIKMVITGADPVQRIVTEINASPAAAEYARLIGVPQSELSLRSFATRPPMVRAGGEYFVRSIQTANPDGSLTFYCAIDEGIVLTLGESIDVIANLQNLFSDLKTRIGPIDRIIGFDCVLNRIEIEQRQMGRPISQLLIDNRVVGFNSYGEQFHGLHVNQTFSGLAIGQ